MLRLDQFETMHAADAHTRRVTLNLLQHAACCPEDVRITVERLEAADWKWNTLSDVELETLFARVDKPLVDKAVAEFKVDLNGIIDHYWRRHEDRKNADGVAWCRLCGQPHVRWEFPLRNVAQEPGGRDVWTGSTCIEVYGLRVDGAATAEAALQALRGAITQAKDRVTAHEWQLEHPDAPAEIATLVEATTYLNVYYWRLPEAQRARLPRNWGHQPGDKGFISEVRAVAKYHRGHGFLTPKRTDDVYRPGGLLERAKAIVARWTASKDGTELPPADDEWTRFIAANPGMNDYQRGRVRYFQQQGYSRSQLYEHNRRLIEEIERQTAQAKMPVPPPPLPPKRGMIVVDDTSDLPL